MRMQFAASDLNQAIELGDRGVSADEAADPSHGRLERPSESLTYAKELLAHNHLTFDPAMHDEGYIIVPDGQGGLAVIAETSAGIFYGAQTVKQLIRGSGKDAVLLVPTLRDWPAMAHRGLSDDWSRGPLPNMDFLKREIRTLAAYKYNIFSPYFEHTFAYASSPVAAFPGGAMTPDEAPRAGGLRGAISHHRHSRAGVVWAPAPCAQVRAVLAAGRDAAWRGARARRCRHAAADRRVGSASWPRCFPVPTRTSAPMRPSSWAWAGRAIRWSSRDWARSISTSSRRFTRTLEPNHKRLLFWGDIAVNSPELVGTLPKDMIAVPWHYDAEPDFTPMIEPFTKAGLETWVAPGVSNWNRLYPNNNEALGNIRAFVRDGQKLGATGDVEHGVERRRRGHLRRELVWRAVWRGSGLAAGRELGGGFYCFVWAGVSPRPDRQDQPGAA